jgi:low affinity Fe/Cu permease
MQCPALRKGGEAALRQPMDTAVRLPRYGSGRSRKLGRRGVMKAKFSALAEQVANAVGSHWAFLIAALTVVIWAATGPLFGYSDTWQLVINTGTTIVTFLMVFLIQNTQNRQTRVMALKLDELLRAGKDARTAFVNLDHMTDDELQEVQMEFNRLRERYAPLVDDDLEHIEREISSRKSKP